ncbi:hypothetical protein BGY98DRAFT_1094981 [Russula aff. rugulosa BPL654]|nr:hypothetical protein BGY98DRAFT_1094981 [Russula aff. rugulosa BPL654]
MAISVASALEQAQLASLCLTTFLYGFFFALFMVTTAITYHNASESTRQQRMKVLPVSLAMLLLATLYISIVWIRAYYGFVDRTAGSNELFYKDISHTNIKFKMACLCTLSLMRDGIIIWRMYDLYNKRFVVVAPAALLVVAYTAVACIVPGLVAKLSAGADVFKVLEAWICAFFLLTMVTNVLCSGAIALRIFVNGNPLRNLSTIWLAALVFVESSTLYALSVIAALTTFLSSLDGQYPAMDAIVLLVSALIIPQICFYVSALTDSLSDSQLLNAAWLGHKGYTTIVDEDPEYPLLQTHTTVSLSKHTHASLLEPISEIDEPSLLWLIWCVVYMRPSLIDTSLTIREDELLFCFRT